MSSLPCGTRNYSYAEDMAIFRTKTQWGLLIGFLIVLFLLPLFLNNFWLRSINIIGIYNYLGNRVKYSYWLLWAAIYRPYRIYGCRSLHFCYLNGEIRVAVFP